MKITFKRKDNDYPGYKEYIKPVVDQAFFSDTFIEILCEILNVFNEYSNDICYKILKALKLGEFKVNEKEKDAYKSFSNSLYSFYYNVVSDDFGKFIFSKNQDLYNKNSLKFEDRRLQRYRGLLFEALVTKIVSIRFEEGEFETGCKVYINSNMILIHYGEGNAKHKETFDFAGWKEKEKYGEFHEFKINPSRFTKENYQLFAELIRQLNINNVSNYLVSVACADFTTNMKECIKSIEETMEDTEKIKFEVYGRDKLANLGSKCAPNKSYLLQMSNDYSEGKYDTAFEKLAEEGTILS